MSGESFRWRTIAELAVISVALYFFFGSSGFSTPAKDLTSTEKDVPVARAKAESLVYPDKGLKCPKHEFESHIFSTNPLVIYVHGFVSENEAEHLIDIRFVPSKSIL